MGRTGDDLGPLVCCRKACHKAKRRVGVVLAVMLGPERPEVVLPDRALCLPTFNHLLIVNKLLSLSLSLSLSHTHTHTLKSRCTHRPSITYLILSLSLSLSLSLYLSIYLSLGLEWRLAKFDQHRPATFDLLCPSGCAPRAASASGLWTLEW